MQHDTLRTILSRPGAAHFVGVGGVGMAGVAFLLRRLGWKVSGCDASDGPLLPWLEANGVKTCAGHSPGHVGGTTRPDLVVRTPAVRDDAPELSAARAAGIPVAARGEALAALSGLFDAFAVCGSHGKTTTSTFLAAILRETVPERTWWCIGGTCGPDQPVAGAPAAGPGPSDGGEVRPLLVAEADESDGTLALYEPFATIVTNVDLDHADRFPDVPSFERVFSEAMARTSRAVVYCADHPRAAALARTAGGGAARSSFGFSEGADWRISGWKSSPDGTSEFALSVPPLPGRNSAARAELRVFLPLPGRHNALNAAAAIAAAAVAGIPPETAAAALSRKAALPGRRFERIGKPDGFTVVSDYSHHPAEIRALVETARSTGPSRIVAVFQPHRYTRTRALLDEFPPAFRGVDELVLCPVYAASEDPLPGGTTADLHAAFRRVAGVPSPVLAGSLDEAFAFLAAGVRRGDAVLVVGAGDVDSLAPRLAAVRPAAEPEPRPPVSAYGTRAPVPRLREASTERDVRAALDEARERGLPFAVVGAGTNTLVAGTGFRGVLLRLAKSGFSWISPVVLPGEPEDGALRMLEAGAATPGSLLLSYCRSLGISGLEPMTGIPGTVGGWLAMNAGVRSGCFGDVVDSALCVRAADGLQVRLGREELRFSYRSCAGLEGFVAVSVRLRLAASTPDRVGETMDRQAEARVKLPGLRTCGSVFKNPGGGSPPAGALADAAGCKGLRVGGAFVTEVHANIFAAGPDASASDVAALVEIVRNRVRESSGIELSPEIRILR